MSGTLYHLVPKTTWIKSKLFGEDYFPPTYKQDGFIHLTEDPKMLLEVANQFYTDVPGDFLVLCIDSTKLTSGVKFEAAADVGDKKTGGALTGQTFPHLYGAIDHLSVIKELPVTRDRLVDGGRFQHIAGLAGGDLVALDSTVEEAKQAKQASLADAKAKAKAAEATSRANAEAIAKRAQEATAALEATKTEIATCTKDFMIAKADEIRKEDEAKEREKKNEEKNEEGSRFASEKAAKELERLEAEREQQAGREQQAARLQAEMDKMARARAEAEAQVKAELEANAAAERASEEAEAKAKEEARKLAEKLEQDKTEALKREEERRAKEKAAAMAAVKKIADQEYKIPKSTRVVDAPGSPVTGRRPPLPPGKADTSKSEPASSASKSAGVTLDELMARRLTVKDLSQGMSKEPA
eukprot:CAMPEP_0118927298 /NCGR_PEP_ID=MMETSP1169-20130426/4799_1 /TAXON_ID=36882 /ORGANISM="Pyramimonas obovata, Strain CCMP722" /LENGTH=412 /DNA_ID=CAMNT_0006869039 /DNA_START=96 /DNA_END=1330 /DNA_ORIENTATION=-